MIKQEIILSLTTKYEYAVKLLEERIQEGHYLLENINNLQCKLDIVEIKYDIWNECNKFILKKIFEVPDIIDEYNNAQLEMYIEDIYNPPSISELFDRMNDKIQAKLNIIYSLVKDLS